MINEKVIKENQKKVTIELEKAQRELDELKTQLAASRKRIANYGKKAF